jgi:transposase
MARRISLEPHLTIEELEGRYRSTKDPVERSRWHFLWLLARGLTAKAIAGITGYSAYWIGRIAHRYNERGPDGVKDRRHQSRPSTPLLSASQRDELVAALATGGAPEGDRWSGRTVASWISQRLGRRVGRHLGWAYLRHLGARLCVPRPRHVQADPQAQADFKQRLRPLLRQMATAFPQATVELWAVDEHRIGLKPILKRVWTLPGQRPIAPVEHQYDWRYVVDFVHPASGRTVWHLATTVSIEFFSVELEAFADAVGASPTKQIVLVLDGAGWHESPRVRVPEHIHLLFLPPHSPELQPAEHLWPLTNTVLAHRHFASIAELEDAQAERCVALQGQQDLVRSATRFHWWPRQTHRRHGPRAREEGSTRAGNTDPSGAASPRGSTRSPARQLHPLRTGDAPPAGRLRVLSCRCRLYSSDAGASQPSRSWERSE